MSDFVIWDPFEGKARRFRAGKNVYFRVLDHSLLLDAIGETITPPQIASDQNNYNPFGDIVKSCALRLSSDTIRNITGLTASSDDGILVVAHNIGSNDIVLVNSSGLSLPANQFLLKSNLTISANGGVALRYDGISLRWRAFSSY